jgi:hypothetical protein
MKSKLSIKEKEEQALKFPLLARYKAGSASGLVVLFTTEKKGTVVVEASIYKLGYHEEGWNRVTDSGSWEILPAGSSVTLIQ